ncbi:MAG: hypothetical protein ABEH47_07750 [Haloferacaceae archaeon]
MSDHHADADALEAQHGEGAAPGTETVEAYEVDDGVVLYDAENPLAWVEASTAVVLAEAR